MLKGFSKGLNSLRPVPFWSWNDKLNKEELFSQMQKMRDAGYGGFFMHSRVGLVTEYMSEEWLNLVRFCAEKSEELEQDAYLYDEDMWPSGYASGEVPALSDEFKERALVLVDKEGLRPTDEIFKTCNQDGKTLYVAKRITPAGNPRFGGQCYIDALNPKTIQAFFKTTHEKYKERLSDLFGKRIKGMFTDEPCYGMHWFYQMPHVPYSECLRERILKEKGYDVKDFCDLLFFDIGEYKKIRYDYFTLAGNQLCDSYTKQYDKWCSDNGIAYTGHLMAEDTLYEQAMWTGGVMQNYAYMRHPGIDKLQRGTFQLVTLKQLTSVSEQTGKERALSECFAGIGHESGYKKRKQIIDWQAVNGITFVNAHLSHYSLRGERKRDYPPDIFYQQPYFKEEKLFSDYTARLCQIAKYGKRAVRILIIQPLGSVFAGYNPNDKNNQEKLKIYDEYLENLSKTLQNNHIDFHYGDEELLEKFAKTKNGKIIFGEYEYDTVVLCHTESLKKSTVKLLNEFGGKIVALGQLPKLCEYRNGINLRIDERYESVLSLVNSLSSYKIANISADGAIICKRQSKDGDIYLIANPTDKSVEIQTDILKDAFILDITNGVGYSINQSKAILYENGSLAIFTGKLETLNKWGIQILPLPAISADGVKFYEYNCTSVKVPQAKVIDENALVIDRADFISGETSLKDVPLSAIWHYHFYKLPEGTPYKIRYKFYVESLPKKPIQLVIENAENADSITLNGINVECMRFRGEPQRTDEKAYKDLSFTRCNVRSYNVGENEIIIKAKKFNNVTDVCNHRPVREKEYYPTEAEIVYVVGDFTVKNSEKGYVISANEEKIGTNVAKSGYPFYSGAIEYSITHDFNNEEILLNADCTVAKVEIRGEKFVAGNTLVFDTRKFKGVHDVKITLYNTLYALLGPHHIEGYDDLLWVDPGVFNDLSKYNKTCLIKPFGLKKIKIIHKGEEKQ